jgi:dihydroorotase
MNRRTPANITISGGRVIDPANQVDKVTDVHLADGKVLAVGKAPKDFVAKKTINATGCLVCPGLIDLSVHLREPGFEHKATIASETRAAVSAGITSVVCPPDTNPVADSAAVVELIHRQANAAGRAHVLPLGALTRNLDGEQLSEMHTLKEAGVVGLSNARRPITNTLVLRRAMEYAATHKICICLSAADPWLSNQGVVHEGEVSTRLGLPGIPEAAETAAIARDLVLIEESGVCAHFGRLSTARAAQLIGRAQHDGLSVSADVAIHQLYLTDIDIRNYDSNCHVNPPLRSQRDKDGLRDAVAKGVIKAICSDHQPHEADAKLMPFAETAPGIAGLETLLPLVLRLADEGCMSLSAALATVTSGPADILGLAAGRLSVGAAADITVIDPDASWFVSKDKLRSHGHNTPFLGWEMTGRVKHTLVDGQLVYSADYD